MGLLPKLSTWQFVLLLIAYLLSIPPRYAWHRASQEYKLIRRRIQRFIARLPLTPAMETVRGAAEEANKRHPFMRLPPELRIRIYELSMLTDVVIIPHGLDVYARSHPTIYDLQQNLPDGASDLQGEEETDIEYPRRLAGILRRPKEAYAAQSSRVANMSQVSRVWRGEALRSFYANNIFMLYVCEHFGTKGQGWGTGQRNREFWTNWLRRRPREALSVTTLIWHDLRVCSHELARGRRPRRMQSADNCVVCVDLRKGIISAEKRIVPADVNQVSCELCWESFAKAIEKLNEEFCGFFSDLQDEAEYRAAAINLIDRLDKRLTVEDSGRGVRPDKVSLRWRFQRLF